jgi:hypothetical protein
MGLTSGVWFCAQTVEMPPSNIATPMPVNRKVQFFMRISQGVCRTTVIALARARYHATLARCNESARAATSERRVMRLLRVIRLGSAERRRSTTFLERTL